MDDLPRSSILRMEISAYNDFYLFFLLVMPKVETCVVMPKV